MSEQQTPEVKIIIKKKKGGHAAAHGGAWKVAYADFVTAMMAFFLLMWLLNSANANTKAGLAGYFKDTNFFATERGKEILDQHGKGILPGGRGMAPGPDGDGGADTAPTEAAAEAEQKVMQQTADAIQKAFHDDQLLSAFEDQLAMDFTDEGLRIQISDKAAQVLFDSGSSVLKPYTLSVLKEIAQELGKLPNRVVLGGHTDSQQYPGKTYTNWELSAERANAARRVMESVKGGLRPGQVRRVTGYADTIPMEGKDPKDPANRRISIVVLSATTEAAEAKRNQGKGTKEVKLRDAKELTAEPKKEAPKVETKGH
ncbi:MAG TPA: flagellar motor protein MotB [Holophagaceae bacterium]|nr:flagellar motor protein MotB [Holophagaceae bacterium]